MADVNQSVFLSVYKETCSITEACRRCGFGRATIYDWLKNDEGFRGRFDSARELAFAALEDEAVRRAMHGIRRYKFHEGKPIRTQAGEHYYELEFSDRLMEVLLRANRPEKYRERYDVKHSHSAPGVVLLQVDEDNAGDGAGAGAVAG